ncbi:hypothetical protein PHLGIDRAFT_68973 [Phlebiopsis gigantea 11061_1 CR5-6]|uniref:DUF2828 domain-containing protein n=1 Tax=Phlebiopsis gigantea (strain 11061_1 CR5-6) TaxID=745531 RepID=A0A0C3PP74_PHLG1|nr:hypothetical protein PHLGIDRAFT_68973 [Phlebiopsis gigantea 11061_1 CR5-6]
MIDALMTTENRTRTTNDDPAYASTLSPTLDLFQALRPECWADDLDGVPLSTKLEKAWQENPELTLRLIWNSRSIHDGKSDRELFYQAFGWLYENHPRTAIQNLEMLVRPVCKIKGEERAPHGYWKDLANIVALAAVGELRPLKSRSLFLHSDEMVHRHNRKTKVKRTPEEIQEMGRQAQVEARERRREKDVGYHHTLATRLADDPRFRALYIAVARLFADRLVKDISLANKMETMEPGDERFAVLRQITLAGKWAPTPSGSHDRVTRLSTAISLLLFHSHSQTLGRPSITLSPESPASLVDSHIIRSFYQRHVLTRLRKLISCPEPLMSSNRWSEIIYTRVPSLCMERNLMHFFRHDPDRFEQYLLDVESGKKSISGATLMPHTLAKAAYAAREEVSGNKTIRRLGQGDLLRRITDVKTRGIEAQWKVMIDRVREAGSLDNCLAVCDVSGSMGFFQGNSKHTQPIEAAVALTLVVSSLAKPPFANKFITFSREPRFGHIDPTGSLADKVAETLGADSGFNTAFDKVFLDLLLPLAIEHKVKPEDMVKRLFVFTDMQFDEARQDWHYEGGNLHDRNGASTWETSHELIERKFKEAGYELPEMVYWNLAQGGSDTFPVTHDKQGVALMNGFSPSMLKVFMGEEGEEEEEETWEAVEQDSTTKEVKEKKKLDPVSLMVKVVSKDSYSGLVVVD